MELNEKKEVINMPYLEERIEHLEKEVQELREAKRAEQYKTPAQLAEIMGCTSQHVGNLIKRGEIEAVRLGTLVRIPMSQFEKKNCNETTSKMKQVIFGKKVSNAG